MSAWVRLAALPGAAEKIRVDEESEIRRFELLEHSRGLLPNGRRAECSLLSVCGCLGAHLRQARRHARKVRLLQLRNHRPPDRETSTRCTRVPRWATCRALALLLLAALVETVDVRSRLLGLRSEPLLVRLLLECAAVTNEEEVGEE